MESQTVDALKKEDTQENRHTEPLPHYLAIDI